MLDIIIASMLSATATLPACEQEDGSGQRATCVWDARHMGDGTGNSFKAITQEGEDDKFVYISHRRAHRLLGL